MPEKDVEFVEYIVKNIVDHPDDVKLDRVIDEMGVLITLSVHPEDMGQVIGREGSTAKSIRTLLRVIGARNNSRVNLKINEPEGSERRPRRSERSERTERTESTQEPSQEQADKVDQVMDDLKL